MEVRIVQHLGFLSRKHSKEEGVEVRIVQHLGFLSRRHSKEEDVEVGIELFNT